MTRALDLAGFRSGALVALHRVENSKNGRVCWLCQCDCGNTTIAVAADIKSGHTKTCGCRSLRHPKHGYASTKIYKIWKSMNQRCHNPKNKSYPRYGARGIFVCDRWKEFSSFLEDMGVPEKGLSLDRIDNDKGYSPDNCRWVNSKTQNRNRRDNNLIDFNGEVKTLAEWAEEKQMPYSTLSYRIHRGWDVEKALLTPVRS